MAQRRAASLARAHAGVVAFSRAGDPATGDFEDAVILSQAGEVDLGAVSVWGNEGMPEYDGRAGVKLEKLALPAIAVTGSIGSLWCALRIETRMGEDAKRLRALCV